MLQETVSFEGYKRLAFRVKGIEMYHDQTTESRPSVEIKEVDESFTLPLDQKCYFGGIRRQHDVAAGNL